jgi:dual specificity tyrosine-phosphorylation-regulated kinase 2/3/4
MIKGILQCLRVLRRNRIIHCDLKPENVLLRDKDSTGVKVIDFGSSCFESEQVHTYIQSRFYRAPEVILNSGYTPAIDMWSLGCMVAELYNGQPLFPGHDEKEQLMYQMEVLGIPPDDVLSRGKRASVFFDGVTHPRFLVDHKARRHEPGSRTLVAALGGSPDATMVSFLEGCLQWDPEVRMTPAEALRHPFITGALGSFERSLKGALPVITPARPSKRASIVSLSNVSSLNTSLANSSYAEMRQKPTAPLLPHVTKTSF